MRLRAWVGVLVVATTPARADDGITIRAPQRMEASREPLLHLDTTLPVLAEGLDATTRRETRIIERGRARLVTEGTWWTSTPTPQDVANGWRAGAELSYDLGPFRIAASAAIGRVDDRFERGTYRIIGLTISRAFRLSRWNTAWIAVGISHQQWNGTPPPGEANATTVGLTVGVTFR